MKKLHNRRQPRGLEWVILKKLPKILLGGIAVPMLMSLLIRLLPLEGTATAIAKQHSSIDILAIAIAITIATAVFTVAIGCVIVIVMKGPAYVADAYKLKDSEHPREDDES